MIDATALVSQMQPQPIVEEHQRGQPSLFEQRGADKADRAGLLCANRLDVDPEALRDLVGGKPLDKEQLEDLAQRPGRFSISA
jgi:hypothetical protein